LFELVCEVGWFGFGVDDGVECVDSLGDALFFFVEAVGADLVVVEQLQQFAALRFAFGDLVASVGLEPVGRAAGDSTASAAVPAAVDALAAFVGVDRCEAATLAVQRYGCAEKAPAGSAPSRATRNSDCACQLWHSDAARGGW